MLLRTASNCITTPVHSNIGVFYTSMTQSKPQEKYIIIMLHPSNHNILVDTYTTYKTLWHTCHIHEAAIHDVDSYITCSISSMIGDVSCKRIPKVTKLWFPIVDKNKSGNRTLSNYTSKIVSNAKSIFKSCRPIPTYLIKSNGYRKVAMPWKSCYPAVIDLQRSFEMALPSRAMLVLYDNILVWILAANGIIFP